MSSVTRPRGPLPARVYWTRRLLVLGLALGLVFGINQLLGSEPPRSTGPSARPAAASAASPSDASSADAAALAGTPNAAGVAPVEPTTGIETPKRRARKTKAPLAVPTGPCLDSDVVVAPSVDGNAYAGGDVTLTLNLTTREAAACTWEVSADSVVLRLSSGDDRIWSTQDCPAAITRQSVVVRKEHPGTAQVVWSGRRSDEECSRTTAWALPGYYHATAAAFGGEPAAKQFELQAPPRPTITPTPTVKPDHETDEETGNKPGKRRGKKSE